jgi:hypothetical protein
VLERRPTGASRTGQFDRTAVGWFEGQLDLDPEPLVFIDDTWADQPGTAPWLLAAGASGCTLACPTAAGPHHSRRGAPLQWNDRAYSVHGTISRAAVHAHVAKCLCLSSHPASS